MSEPTNSYVPYAERTDSIRAAAVSLQAGALLEHLAATSDEDLRRIARELDDSAKCVRAILRQCARSKQQAAGQAAVASVADAEQSARTARPSRIAQAAATRTMNRKPKAECEQAADAVKAAGIPFGLNGHAAGEE